MSEFQLLWSSRSPFVRKVMIFAHEAGLVDRLKLVPKVTSAQRPDPDILKLSPANRIPALVRPDGSVVLESHFICEYLDTLHDGAPLFPEGDKRWEALHRAAVASALMDNLLNWRREKARPEDEASMAFRGAYRDKFRSCLRAMKGMKLDSVSPPRFDIGDISVAAALAYLDFRFADIGWRDEAPELAGWLDSISGHRSMRATEFSQ